MNLNLKSMIKKKHNLKKRSYMYFIKSKSVLINLNKNNNEEDNKILTNDNFINLKLKFRSILSNVSQIYKKEDLIKRKKSLCLRKRELSKNHLKIKVRKNYKNFSFKKIGKKNSILKITKKNFKNEKKLNLGDFLKNLKIQKKMKIKKIEINFLRLYKEILKEKNFIFLKIKQYDFEKYRKIKISISLKNLLRKIINEFFYKKYILKIEKNMYKKIFDFYQNLITKNILIIFTYDIEFLELNKYLKNFSKNFEDKKENYLIVKKNENNIIKKILLNILRKKHDFRKKKNLNTEKKIRLFLTCKKFVFKLKKKKEESLKQKILEKKKKLQIKKNINLFISKKNSFNLHNLLEKEKKGEIKIIDKFSDFISFENFENSENYTKILICNKLLKKNQFNNFSFHKFFGILESIIFENLAKNNKNIFSLHELDNKIEKFLQKYDFIDKIEFLENIKKFLNDEKILNEIPNN